MSPAPKGLSLCGEGLTLYATWETENRSGRAGLETDPTSNAWRSFISHLAICEDCSWDFDSVLSSRVARF